MLLEGLNSILKARAKLGLRKKSRPCSTFRVIHQLATSFSHLTPSVWNVEKTFLTKNFLTAAESSKERKGRKNIFNLNLSGILTTKSNICYNCCCRCCCCWLHWNGWVLDQKERQKHKCLQLKTRRNKNLHRANSQNWDLKDIKIF